MDMDSKFKNFDGQEFSGDTFRQAALNVLGGLRATNGVDAIKSYDVGIKIIAAKDISALSTDDKGHLIKKVNQAIEDNLGYPAIVMAQMLKALQ